MRAKALRVARKFNIGNYESRELMVEVELDSTHEFNLQVIRELEARLVEANLVLEQQKKNLIKETTDKVLAQLGVSASSTQNGKKES